MRHALWHQQHTHPWALKERRATTSGTSNIPTLELSRRKETLWREETCPLTPGTHTPLSSQGEKSHSFWHQQHTPTLELSRREEKLWRGETRPLTPATHTPLCSQVEYFTFWSEETCPPTPATNTPLSYQGERGDTPSDTSNTHPLP